MSDQEPARESATQDIEVRLTLKNSNDHAIGLHIEPWGEGYNFSQ